MNRLPKFIKNSDILFKKLYNNSSLNTNIEKYISCNKKSIILGIETSCDDTGIAIVDSTGKILGQALNSQLIFHLMEGGINPIVAKKLHEINIESVFQECIKSANIDINHIDAIATTVEPGLPHSLIIGRDFGLNLSKEFNKPFIPIHHMQAHALTARLYEKVEFPFLVLLMSGKHCSLVLANSVSEFKLLGETYDSAPGHCLDSVARRLKLINILEYSKISGGKAVELAAMKADNPEQFQFPLPMPHCRSCNFSFSGLTSSVYRTIELEEEKHNIILDDIIPNVNNLCAALIIAILKHIFSKTERAMQFLIKEKLIPQDKKTLVISGGVASNNLIAKGLEKLCSEKEFRLVKTQPNLCTDNGIMVAWNGVEKYVGNTGVIRNRDEINKVDIKWKSLIGEDWSDIVLSKNIKNYKIKIKFNELQR